MSSKRLLQIMDEFEPPLKKLVSEADCFLKDLVRKQQNTTVNLHQELAHPKEFCKGAELVSLANYFPGTSTLDQFQKNTTNFESIAGLKAAGLVEADIKLYLDFQKGENYLLDKHKNCQISVLKESIERIKHILEKYTKESSNLIVEKPKERSNVGLFVKPGSDATKLYKFALENEGLKKKPCIPCPMDNIKNIEENFIKSLDELKLPNIKNIRRKARKLHNRVNCNGETSSCSNTSEDSKTTNLNINPYVTNSKWDQKTQTLVQKPCKQKRLYTCSSQNYYTIKDGEIVRLTKSECDKTDHSFPKKLTLDEITKIPKFKDYIKGVPSKVLYLKNLSNCVKELDLKELFKNYSNTQQISYKLMKAKLKGQAFITFPDESSASKALEEFNGVFLKTKPVIIQFGRGKG